MGQMTLVYSKKQDLDSLLQKRDEVCYHMIEAQGRQFKEFEKELEYLEEQIEQLEQELN